MTGVSGKTMGRDHPVEVLDGSGRDLDPSHSLEFFEGDGVAGRGLALAQVGSSQSTRNPVEQCGDMLRIGVGLVQGLR